MLSLLLKCHPNNKLHLEELYVKPFADERSQQSKWHAAYRYLLCADWLVALTCLWLLSFVSKHKLRERPKIEKTSSGVNSRMSTCMHK